MLVHEKPSVFADSIFELIGAIRKGCVVGFGNLMLLCNADVENEGQLDFSEFVKAVSTYCMFGKEDILKCMAAHRWCSLVAFRLIVHCRCQSASTSSTRTRMATSKRTSFTLWCRCCTTMP